MKNEQIAADSLQKVSLSSIELESNNESLEN